MVSGLGNFFHILAVLGNHVRPYKTTQGHTRQFNTLMCHRRLHLSPVCPHCVSMNFIFTQRNIFFVPYAHFLFPCTYLFGCTFFVPLQTFCFIWNIFSSFFHAKNNIKASFRTFERYSRSKKILFEKFVETDFVRY